MSGVDYNPDGVNKNEFHIYSRRLLGNPETPTIINFLLKKKIVKNEKQALVLILSFVALFFAISFYLLFYFGKGERYVILPDNTVIPASEYIKGLKSGIYY